MKSSTSQSGLANAAVVALTSSPEQLTFPFPQLDTQTATDITVNAAKYFQPRSPISTRDFFAGRWEQLTTVVDGIAQKGLHIVLFGERGVGKSSLANIIEPVVYVMEDSLTGGTPKPRLVAKVNINRGDTFSAAWKRLFDEVSWIEDKPVMGLAPAPSKVRMTLRQAFQIDDDPSIDDVRRTLMALPRSIVIFDEFDRGSASLKTDFTDLIKALSDYAVDSTIVLVGVADTIDQLFQGHASIARALVQIHLPRMHEKELREILDRGSKALGMSFTDAASTLTVKMSQGLPHYTHLIGLYATREATKRLSRQVAVEDVHSSFDKAISHAIQGLQEQYLKAVHSAHKDALYDQILLACAAASSCANDVLGYFHPIDVVKPLAKILNRTNVRIATFQKHIAEFCEPARGKILERAGTPRAYKYRFCEPLLPPFIFMTAITSQIINDATLEEITA
jgi:Cdc6-like AAA superfamily ATPase